MGFDDRLLQLLAKGDVDAAAVLVIGKFGPAILGYLRAILAEDDAEDVFKQWAEDVWHGLPGFHGECSLRAWCYRLAWRALP